MSTVHQHISHFLSRYGAVLLLLFFVAVSTAAQAQQNFYGGVSIGSFDGEVVNGSDTGWKIFGGYQLNQNLALEVSYVDLGTVKETFLGSTFRAEQSGIAGVIVGSAPINKQFSFFGKIGLFLWDADIKFTNVLLFSGSESDSGTDITYGVGLKYDFNKRVGVRAEWDHYEDDIGDLLSVGVSFNF